MSSGRKLKNKALYINKIKQAAKSLRVKVQFSDYPEHLGKWNPNKRCITVHYGQSDSALISTLLHELGHAIDDLFIEHTRREYNAIDTAYKMLHNNRASSKHKKIIRNCEDRAWKLGEALAKALGIKLGPWFYEDAKQALKTYAKI